MPICTILPICRILQYYKQHLYVKVNPPPGGPSGLGSDPGFRPRLAHLRMVWCVLLCFSVPTVFHCASLCFIAMIYYVLLSPSKSNSKVNLNLNHSEPKS